MAAVTRLYCIYEHLYNHSTKLAEQQLGMPVSTYAGYAACLLNRLSVAGCGTWTKISSESTEICLPPLASRRGMSKRRQQDFVDVTFPSVADCHEFEEFASATNIDPSERMNRALRIANFVIDYYGADAAPVISYNQVMFKQSGI